ncbi:MAG: ABC transporter permease subunit, partial [Pseudomonadota bacterium]
HPVLLRPNRAVQGRGKCFKLNRMAAVFAGVVMLIGIVTLSIDTWMMRESRRYAVIGGKGTPSRLAQLRIWRISALVMALLLFLVGVILPLGALFLSTIMHVPGRFTAENFTLAYWIGRDLPTIAVPTGILLSPDFWSAAWNTMRIVGTAAICSGLLGMIVGYIVVRSPNRALSVALRQITFFPYLVPGIAFAAAFLVLFAVPRGPIPALYGTPWILLLALIADQMPFASRAGISSMTQLGHDVEDAAKLMGAGWMRRMRSIIIPINKGALVSGILMPFISGIKGVSLFIMLAVPATDVLSTYSLRLVDYNYTQASNAVVLMISLIAVLGTLLVNRLTGTGLARGLES